MTDEESQIRLKLQNDFPHYASKCLKIKTKKVDGAASGAGQPFILNKEQLYLHGLLEKQLKETGKVRAIILKGRQLGCSTYVGGRFYHKVTHNFGAQAFIFTHRSSATDSLYTMTKRFYEFTPEIVRPSIKKSNAKELIFGELDSGYKIGTAESRDVGRGDTIHYFHGSEVASWPRTDEHSTGIMEAISNEPGTEIILESTAKGVGNYFHQQWQAAEAGLSEYIAIFIPWFWNDRYVKKCKDDFCLSDNEKALSKLYGLNNEQLNWRRFKIISLSGNGESGEKKFCQEYPCNPDEAFQVSGEDTYIPSDLVMAARKCKAEAYGPIIMGVDVARLGNDRTSIAIRQGRVLVKLISYTKKELMETVGIVNSLILEYSPVKVFIDVGGLGVGVYDRLAELWGKTIIQESNAASSALDPRHYLKKRDELWGLTKLWLQDVPCQIPDIDSLHSDLTGIKYKVDSLSRLVMESKDQMSSRGIRSPDEADALGLTFTLPYNALKEDKNSAKAKSLAAHFNSVLEAQTRSYGV